VTFIASGSLFIDWYGQVKRHDAKRRGSNKTARKREGRGVRDRVRRKSVDARERLGEEGKKEGKKKASAE